MDRETDTTDKNGKTISRYACWRMLTRDKILSKCLQWFEIMLITDRQTWNHCDCLTLPCQRWIHKVIQTLATKPSPTRTFCIFKSPWMTGCGLRECRYSIPQTTPWERNNFVGQSTWNVTKKMPTKLQPVCYNWTGCVVQYTNVTIWHLHDCFTTSYIYNTSLQYVLS